MLPMKTLKTVLQLIAVGLNIAIAILIIKKLKEDDYIIDCEPDRYV